MVTYNKHEVREKLTINDIYELLTEWGGEPEWTSFGILSTTICHNMPGQGSRKLYYYSNTDLFQCYTGCGYFDVFDLLVKVARIQWQKEYDMNILKNLNYKVRIKPWLDENISQEVLEHAVIGYFPPTGQITIPHFDPNNRFIGLRGRTLVKEEAERFGKYRPLIVGWRQYNHPLGMNLYNLNNSKDNIKQFGMAICFEAEKSCLKYQSYFGIENDISVACCGSNISAY